MQLPSGQSQELPVSFKALSGVKDTSQGPKEETRDKVKQKVLLSLRKAISEICGKRMDLEKKKTYRVR